MTRSGCTVLLARSKAFTKATFSAALICMIFLLTGRGGGEAGRREKESEKGVVEVLLFSTSLKAQTSLLLPTETLWSQLGPVSP